MASPDASAPRDTSNRGDAGRVLRIMEQPELRKSMRRPGRLHCWLFPLLETGEPTARRSAMLCGGPPGGCGQLKIQHCEGVSVSGGPVGRRLQ